MKPPNEPISKGKLCVYHSLDIYIYRSIWMLYPNTAHHGFSTQFHAGKNQHLLRAYRVKKNPAIANASCYLTDPRKSLFFPSLSCSCRHECAPSLYASAQQKTRKGVFSNFLDKKTSLKINRLENETSTNPLFLSGGVVFRNPTKRRKKRTSESLQNIATPTEQNQPGKHGKGHCKATVFSCLQWCSLFQ